MNVFCVSAQEKEEREFRTTRDSLPAPTRDIIAKLPKNIKKLRFFKESDGDKQSFEIKFKYKKKSFSIEFDNLGTIEDTEMLIKKKDIIPSVYKSISNFMSNEFDKVIFIKIQKQFPFTHHTTAIDTYLKKTLDDDFGDDINYEIIVEIKKSSLREFREYTFDSKGLFVSYRALKPSSYDHVLY